VLDNEADEVFRQTLEIGVLGSCRDEVRSQLGVNCRGTGRVQDRLLFKERGEQVEESPLTLVEILSRNHGGGPDGHTSRPPRVRGVLLVPAVQRMGACNGGAVSRFGVFDMLGPLISFVEG
jgi:hypothetical protein